MAVPGENSGRLCRSTYHSWLVGWVPSATEISRNLHVLDILSTNCHMTVGDMVQERVESYKGRMPMCAAGNYTRQQGRPVIITVSALSIEVRSDKCC